MTREITEDEMKTVLQGALTDVLGPPITDQPAPVVNDNPSTWQLVLADMANPVRSITHDQVMADMAERERIGKERYGTVLQAHNGRSFLVDAYQERLDYAVYARGWLAENTHRCTSFAYFFVDSDYRDTLRVLQTLRHLINTTLPALHHLSNTEAK